MNDEKKYFKKLLEASPSLENMLVEATIKAELDNLPDNKRKCEEINNSRKVNNLILGCICEHCHLLMSILFLEAKGGCEERNRCLC